MILDHEGMVVDDPEESYTIKTLNNEVDALTTGLDILIKHRDNTVAKMYELRKENDALRAKWESVPWAALNTAIWLMASYLPGSKEADYDALIAFVESNAPKEDAE